MRPGQSIRIRLKDREGNVVALKSVLIHIEFFMHGSYRYGFAAGRTDHEGRLVVSYGDLEEQRRRYSLTNLMDYNTRLEDCDPTVNLSILSEEELCSRRQKAAQAYGKDPEWAKTWPSNAQVQAQATTVELSYPITDVAITVERT